LIRAQKRQVSKVLLDGLYDPDSPINKLLGVRTEIVGEIIWKKLVENWQIFPEHLSLPADTTFEFCTKCGWEIGLGEFCQKV